jgi:transposase-like protein
MDACPKCTHPHVVKAGKVRGQQRWLCRGCGYQFTRSTPRGRPPWQQSLAVFLYCHGVSMNALAKMFGVWASTTNLATISETYMGSSADLLEDTFSSYPVER